MLHLSAERLAALGDDLPTTDESAHLAVCAECAREVDAYRSLVTMAAAEGGSMGLPLTRWDAIAAALDGTQPALTLHSSPLHAPRAPRGASRWPLQVAAGLLLVAGGAMLGRTSVGRTPLPLPGESARVAAATAQLAVPASDSVAFSSVEEARRAQQRSELVFQQAAAYLAAADTTNGLGASNPVAYRSRLSALDRVISTTREALREAPHDPVINEYYLSTLGQREATLRQLNTALPASLRLNSF